MVACGPNFEQQKNKNYLYLSSQEQRELTPNKLFQAVLNEESIEVLQKIVNENSIYLYSTNIDKNTPLGLAFKIHNPEAAQYLISQLSLKDLTHQNNEGESYIYLAAQKGYPDLIVDMANKFYELSTFNYEFSGIDQSNHHGEKALHVAKSVSVVEALKDEYYRGVLELPFRSFSYKKK